MVQWLKYPGARVILFDKDRSARQLTYAVGGSYYEPVTESVEFQPLRRLEREEDLIWASEFIELLLGMQGIADRCRDELGDHGCVEDHEDR